MSAIFSLHFSSHLISSNVTSFKIQTRLDALLRFSRTEEEKEKEEEEEEEEEWDEEEGNTKEKKMIILS